MAAANSAGKSAIRCDGAAPVSLAALANSISAYLLGRQSTTPSRIFLPCLLTSLGSLPPSSFDSLRVPCFRLFASVSSDFFNHLSSLARILRIGKFRGQSIGFIFYSCAIKLFRIGGLFLKMSLRNSGSFASGFNHLSSFWYILGIGKCRGQSICLCFFIGELFLKMSSQRTLESSTSGFDNFSFFSYILRIGKCRGQSVCLIFSDYFVQVNFL